MARPKSKGLGDTIANVLEDTGVKKLIDIFVDGEDCGCEQRKEKLNQLFPYRFKARCLTEEEYNHYKLFIEARTLTMAWSDVVWVCDLYASVFSRQVWYPCVGCSPKILIGMINKLDKVFDAYEN